MTFSEQLGEFHFYPPAAIRLIKCVVYNTLTLRHFVKPLLRPGQQILSGEVEYVDGMNAIDWDDNLKTTFQKMLDNATQNVLCGVDFVS